MKPQLIATAAALLMAMPAAAQTGCRDFFASGAPRWEEPQDTIAALIEPDCYAWQLFVALNWPAVVDQKAPDSTKEFGDEGRVVWETWRNVRNGAPDTVFKMDGSDPGDWLDGVVPDTRLFSEFDDQTLQQIVASQGVFASIDDIAAEFFVNETRMSKASYEFTRANELYNIEGQLALFAAGTEKIDFPLEAKEVKAQWRVIEEADKPRYHWTNVTRLDGTTAIYGLTALHITTKDIPNWFWATFEHIDNRTPAAPTAENPNGAEGWLLPSIDRFACPTAPHDCEAPPSVGFETTKWANYVLRGTQIDFVDGRGNPTLLANSQPEQGFQETSSCITCHALATVGAGGDRLPFFATLPPASRQPVGQVGAPNPDWFRAPGAGDGNEGTLHYTQLDFVWSLMRAQSKQ
ncbi:hypothetical protein [uncultured Roseovarius sp.]|uniref:hypothetical protein n=1 Tax=uncultured Roseovarius sp. TaxID=293344 RepID=UPI00263163BC|nr:hypothetical protein [uncultured Roseovarius sp.]